jgi:hypothetical protein
MTVDFVGGTNYRVDYGTLAAVQNLSSKSFMWWMNPSALTAGDVFGMNPSGATDEDWLIVIGAVASKLFMFFDFDTTQGQWRTTNDISTGRHHYAVTYVNTAGTAPIIYVDGVSVAVTTVQNSVGTYRSGTTNSFRLGSRSTGAAAMAGTLDNLLVYNRILSASEISDAYASKLAIPTYRGLVFAPQLWTRGELGEGGTLTSSHTIADFVSGALGTPSGSPLHRQDSFLTFEGIC